MRDEQHDREPRRSRHFRDRSSPFVHLAFAAWVVLPAMGLVFWVVRAVRPALSTLIIICVMSVATLLAVAALGIGLYVTKRIPWVFWHAAVTAWLAGVAVCWFTALGLNLTWLVVYYTFGTGFAGSWMLYRIDALRADRRRDGDDESGLAKLIGTRARFWKVRDTGTAITAQVQPAPGETRKDVERALPKIATAHPDALPEKAYVQWDPDKHAGQVVIPHTDALEPWPRWQGPSNFGGPFDAPFVQGIYFDGTPEQGWYCTQIEEN